MRVLPGVPIQRNANRTSEPAFGANEIVPRTRVSMGSMPSAFRHLSKTHECKADERQVLQTWLSGCESRRGCHFKAHVAQQQRHDVESVASAGASPAVSIIFTVQSLDSEAAGF